MKQGGGDFSAEAYQQLREAYDKEQQRQVDDEVRGTQLMGQEYGLETAPMDSPWADKIDLWKYPDGKQPHMDERQSPDEILQIMRDAAQERIDAQKEDEEVEEEETIDSELSEDENDDQDPEESEESEEAEEDTDDAEEDESEDEVVDADDSDNESEDEDPEPEDEDESLDAESIASEIASLRAELESMQFVPETQDDESE